VAFLRAWQAPYDAAWPKPPLAHFEQFDVHSCDKWFPAHFLQIASATVEWYGLYHEMVEWLES
jgi:hypothetical protein